MINTYVNLNENRVQILPVTPENFTSAIKAAQADAHGSYGLTDIIYKGGEIIGHLSLNGMPLVLPWMHSDKCKARDALYIMNFYENILKRSGMKGFAMPCVDGSPLQPYLERLGYKKMTKSVTMYLKEL